MSGPTCVIAVVRPTQTQTKRRRVLSAPVFFSRSAAQRSGVDRQLRRKGALVRGPILGAGDVGGERRMFLQQARTFQELVVAALRARNINGSLAFAMPIVHSSEKSTSEFVIPRTSLRHASFRMELGVVWSRRPAAARQTKARAPANF